MLPRARQGLVVHNLKDELVVYDAGRDQAHCLNAVAAALWRHCDGRHEIADLVSLVRAEVDAAVDEPAILAGLRRLEEASLLEDAPAASPPSRWSRRRVLQASAACAAIALVVSVPAPAAAQYRVN
jgi:hypothetical protein